MPIAPAVPSARPFRPVAVAVAAVLLLGACGQAYETRGAEPPLPGGDVVTPPSVPVPPVPGEGIIPPDTGADPAPSLPGPDGVPSGRPSPPPLPETRLTEPATSQPEPVSERAEVAGSTGSGSGPGAAAGPCGTVRITEFHLPAGGAPNGIATGDDGAMWFTDPATSTVGRIDPAGAVTRYKIPGRAQAIARGPDGNLWVTLPGIVAVARVTPAGTVTTFPIPDPTDPAPFGFDDLMPMDLTAGPDGAMWFTEAGADQIARIAPDGTVTQYPLPHRHKAHIHPSSITAGPDGGVWFSMNLIGTFGRIDPASGEITELPLPGSGSGLVAANTLTTGSDGRLWFEDPANRAIGRMTTDGTVDHLPTSRRQVSAVMAGSDGGVWFLDMWEDRPVRMSPDGAETVLPPLAGAAVIGHGGPTQMAPASDGAMWFAAPDANRLVRLECR